MADYAKLVPGTRVAMTSENGGLRMGTVKAQQPAGMIDVIFDDRKPHGERRGADRLSIVRLNSGLPKGAAQERAARGAQSFNITRARKEQREAQQGMSIVDQIASSANKAKYIIRSDKPRYNALFSKSNANAQLHLSERGSFPEYCGNLLDGNAYNIVYSDSSGKDILLLTYDRLINLRSTRQITTKDRISRGRKEREIKQARAQQEEVEKNDGQFKYRVVSIKDLAQVEAYGRPLSIITNDQWDPETGYGNYSASGESLGGKAELSAQDLNYSNKSIGNKSINPVLQLEEISTEEMRRLRDRVNDNGERAISVNAVNMLNEMIEISEKPVDERDKIVFLKLVGDRLPVRIKNAIGKAESQSNMEAYSKAPDPQKLSRIAAISQGDFNLDFPVIIGRIVDSKSGQKDHIEIAMFNIIADVNQGRNRLERPFLFMSKERSNTWSKSNNPYYAFVNEKAQGVNSNAEQVQNLSIVDQNASCLTEAEVIKTNTFKSAFAQFKSFLYGANRFQKILSDKNKNLDIPNAMVDQYPAGSRYRAMYEKYIQNAKTKNPNQQIEAEFYNRLSTGTYYDAFQAIKSQSKKVAGKAPKQQHDAVVTEINSANLISDQVETITDGLARVWESMRLAIPVSSENKSDESGEETGQPAYFPAIKGRPARDYAYWAEFLEQQFANPASEVSTVRFSYMKATSKSLLTESVARIDRLENDKEILKDLKDKESANERLSEKQYNYMKLLENRIEEYEENEAEGIQTDRYYFKTTVKPTSYVNMVNSLMVFYPDFRGDHDAIKVLGSRESCLRVRFMFEYFTENKRLTISRAANTLLGETLLRDASYFTFIKSINQSNIAVAQTKDDVIAKTFNHNQIAVSALETLRLLSGSGSSCVALYEWYKNALVARLVSQNKKVNVDRIRAFDVAENEAALTAALEPFKGILPELPDFGFRLEAKLLLRKLENAVEEQFYTLQKRIYERHSDRDDETRKLKAAALEKLAAFRKKVDAHAEQVKESANNNEYVVLRLTASNNPLFAVQAGSIKPLSSYDKQGGDITSMFLPGDAGGPERLKIAIAGLFDFVFKGDSGDDREINALYTAAVCDFYKDWLRKQLEDSNITLKIQQKAYAAGSTNPVLSVQDYLALLDLIEVMLNIVVQFRKDAATSAEGAEADRYATRQEYISFYNAFGCHFRVTTKFSLLAYYLFAPFSLLGSISTPVENNLAKRYNDIKQTFQFGIVTPAEIEEVVGPLQKGDSVANAIADHLNSALALLKQNQDIIESDGDASLSAFAVIKANVIKDNEAKVQTLQLDKNKFTRALTISKEEGRLIVNDIVDSFGELLFGIINSSDSTQLKAQYFPTPEDFDEEIESLKAERKKLMTSEARSNPQGSGTDETEWKNFVQSVTRGNIDKLVREAGVGAVKREARTSGSHAAQMSVSFGVDVTAKAREQLSDADIRIAEINDKIALLEKQKIDAVRMAAGKRVQGATTQKGQIAFAPFQTAHMKQIAAQIYDEQMSYHYLKPIAEEIDKLPVTGSLTQHMSKKLLPETLALAREQVIEGVIGEFYNLTIVLSQGSGSNYVERISGNLALKDSTTFMDIVDRIRVSFLNMYNSKIAQRWLSTRLSFVEIKIAEAIKQNTQPNIAIKSNLNKVQSNLSTIGDHLQQALTLIKNSYTRTQARNIVLNKDMLHKLFFIQYRMEIQLAQQQVEDARVHLRSVTNIYNKFNAYVNQAVKDIKRQEDIIAVLDQTDRRKVVFKQQASASTSASTSASASAAPDISKLKSDTGKINSQILSAVMSTLSRIMNAKSESGSKSTGSKSASNKSNVSDIDLDLVAKNIEQQLVYATGSASENPIIRSAISNFMSALYDAYMNNSRIADIIKECVSVEDYADFALANIDLFFSTLASSLSANPLRMHGLRLFRCIFEKLSQLASEYGESATSTAANNQFEDLYERCLHSYNEAVYEITFFGIIKQLSDIVNVPMLSEGKGSTFARSSEQRQILAERSVEQLYLLIQRRAAQTLVALDRNNPMLMSSESLQANRKQAEAELEQMRKALSQYVNGKAIDKKLVLEAEENYKRAEGNLKALQAKRWERIHPITGKPLPENMKLSVNDIMMMYAVDAAQENIVTVPQTMNPLEKLSQKQSEFLDAKNASLRSLRSTLGVTAVNARQRVTVVKTYNPLLFKIVQTYWNQDNLKKWQDFSRHPALAQAVDDIGLYGTMLDLVAQAELLAHADMSSDSESREITSFEDLLPYWKKNISLQMERYGITSVSYYANVLKPAWLYTLPEAESDELSKQFIIAFYSEPFDLIKGTGEFGNVFKIKERAIHAIGMINDVVNALDMKNRLIEDQVDTVIDVSRQGSGEPANAQAKARMAEKSAYLAQLIEVQFKTWVKEYMQTALEEYDYSSTASPEKDTIRNGQPWVLALYGLTDIAEKQKSIISSVRSKGSGWNERLIKHLNSGFVNLLLQLVDQAPVIALELNTLALLPHPFEADDDLTKKMRDIQVSWESWINPARKFINVPFFPLAVCFLTKVIGSEIPGVDNRNLPRLANSKESMHAYEEAYRLFIEQPVSSESIQKLLRSNYRTKSKPDLTKALSEIQGSLDLPSTYEKSEILQANKKKQELLLYLSSLLNQYKKELSTAR